jgi:BASS family bile acid:Na+ symporter
LLPLFAAWLVSKSSLNPEQQVGIMILSVCPGGITSNLVSYFVRGNVALAVSLTVCNAFLSLFTIPFLVNIFLDWLMPMASVGIIELPFWDTMFDIFIVTIIPAGLGMLVRDKLGNNVYRLSKSVNAVLPILLLLVFAAKFLAKPDQGGTQTTISDIIVLTPYAIILNGGSMLLGFLAGLPFKLSFQNRVTVAIEVGLHNTALALLIAGEKLHQPLMEKPALVYALYSFLVTFGVAYVMVRLQERFFKKPNNIAD